MVAGVREQTVDRKSGKGGGRSQEGCSTSCPQPGRDAMLPDVGIHAQQDVLPSLSRYLGRQCCKSTPVSSLVRPTAEASRFVLRSGTPSFSAGAKRYTRKAAATRPSAAAGLHPVRGGRRLGSVSKPMNFSKRCNRYLGGRVPSATREPTPAICLFELIRAGFRFSVERVR
jgi:hypothetical protein